MPDITLEACVETLEQAVRAEERGADRLELCSRLDLDGLTPDTNLVREVLREVNVPVKVMLRHRPGDFQYGSEDRIVLFNQLAILNELPVHGVVFGALQGSMLDIELIGKIASRSAHPVTVHKAIDLCTDPVAEVARLVSVANVTGVLSSGGAETALKGSETLRKMIDSAGKDLTIVVAGRVTDQNLKTVLHSLGAQEYHGRRIVGEI